MKFRLNYHFAVLMIVMIAAEGHSQEVLCTPFASHGERLQTRESLSKSVDRIWESYPDPLVETKAWTGAFWAMGLLLYRPSAALDRLQKLLKILPSTAPEFQRAFLEMLYTLYPGKFTGEIQKGWEHFSNAKNQAMALEYLAKEGKFPKIKPSAVVYNSEWHEAYRDRWHKSGTKKPESHEFLDSTFLPGQAVICSFQHQNRDRPGVLMIRGPEGTWVSDTSGKPLRIPQLARSISNLPYYLTNGNTPQGLFRVGGFGVSENLWIGPTTNLQMVLPFENENAFFSEDSNPETFYQNILGAKLYTYPSLWESYRAGKLGRTEIIAHGTTIDPEFYREQPYFPCTPSLGCLCSPEIWDEGGCRSYSAQAMWIQALQKLNTLPQWLIVAEVSDY
jgi:hypothetical protein